MIGLAVSLLKALRADEAPEPVVEREPAPPPRAVTPAG